MLCMGVQLLRLVACTCGTMLSLLCRLAQMQQAPETFLAADQSLMLLWYIIPYTEVVSA